MFFFHSKRRTVSSSLSLFLNSLLTHLSSKSLCILWILLASDYIVGMPACLIQITRDFKFFLHEHAPTPLDCEVAMRAHKAFPCGSFARSSRCKSQLFSLCLNGWPGHGLQMTKWPAVDFFPIKLEIYEFFLLYLLGITN